MITTQSLQTLRRQADPGANRNTPIRRDLANDKRFWVFIMMVLALCLCLITRADKLLPCAVFGVVIGIHWMFLLTGRTNVQWVVTPQYLLGILLLLTLVDFKRFGAWAKGMRSTAHIGRNNALAAMAVMLCMVAALVPLVMAYSGNPLPDRQDYQAYIKLDEYTHAHMDKLFFSTIRVMQDQHLAYSVFDPPQQSGMLNRISLGGWLARSPRYQQVMQAQGIDNALTALVRENVYLIADRNIQLIQRYLHLRHGLNTHAKVVWQQDQIYIYKLETT